MFCASGLSNLPIRLLLPLSIAQYVSSSGMTIGLSSSIDIPCITSTRLVFLLLMDDNLVGVMQGMSLQDDVPIVLPEEDDYSAVERRSRSLLGRLLNSASQKRSRMLRTMTKIWKVYETVLKYGFWSFDDWGMVMERWVEFPPSNFLQSAAVWIRIRNIPVNYLTIKTIDSVAGAIGYVKDSDWNP
ncbi:hypothetical protein Bca101_076681 [Brassica carinata]